MTGRDIKSTKEQERDGRDCIARHGGICVHIYYEPDTSAWRKKRARKHVEPHQAQDGAA
ncbi:hypothetical protein ACFV23_21390 [Streptomyces sp. NPDC059627]